MNILVIVVRQRPRLVAVLNLRFLVANIFHAKYKYGVNVTSTSGNAFVEDENGRLFYIAGNVNERPTVCDDDKPIMTSTIRRCALCLQLLL